MNSAEKGIILFIVLFIGFVILKLKMWRGLGLTFSFLAFNRAPRIWVIAGFLIFTIVNVAFIVDEDTSKWQAEDAKILDTGMVNEFFHEKGDDEWFGNSGWGYHPTILYEWQIDGETYESTSYSKKYVNFSTPEAANQWLEDYPVGSNTTAYVNPDDPSDAVLITYTWIQMIGIGDILFNLCCASTCLLLPLLALFTARSFEKTLPEHSHKRYKLVYDAAKPHPGAPSGQAQGGWDSDPEAIELQAMARSAWIKKNSNSLNMDEALLTSMILDSQVQLDGGSRILNVRFDGQDGTIEVKNMNEILENLGEIDDIAIIYLEDSKKMGRHLEFRSDDSGDDWYFHIREFLGEELILEESINMDQNYSAMIEIISNALKSSETEDGEWWN
jgi:hypothetical protein